MKPPLVSLRAAELPKPNLLLMYIDNVGYGDLGCYGDAEVRTPRIDQVAREGVRCTDFYLSTSSWPMWRGSAPRMKPGTPMASAMPASQRRDQRKPSDDRHHKEHRHMKLCPLLCLVSLLVSPAIAEPPKPRNGDKLLIVNDDGFSNFYSGRYTTAADLRKQGSLFKETQIAVLEWCITSGSRTNFPCKTSELVGTGLIEYGRRGDRIAAETLRRLADEKVDTLQLMAQGCHDAGLLCYASMRMNGDYGTVPPENSNLMNSEFWRTHPELRIRGPKGEQRITLSYAHPAVRAFKLGILREAAERDIDGINLDFLRHPPFFGYDEPLVEAYQKQYGANPRTLPADEPRWLQLRADVMTAFLREIRQVLDEAGARKHRRIGLSARIDHREHTMLGCDVDAWTKLGLLDYLVVAQHSLGGYEFDIAPFVAMGHRTGCAVLFGEEGITSGHDTTAAEDKLIAAGKMQPPLRGGLTPEQHRTRADRWYAAGADGVHLFNVGNVTLMKTLGTTSQTKTLPPPASR